YRRRPGWTDRSPSLRPSPLRLIRDLPLSQLSELFRNTLEFGEHQRRVAHSVASEPGSYRVDRAVQSPAGRTSSGAGPVPVVRGAERQLELEDGFVDEMRHRHRQQRDLALTGMVGKGEAGELHRYVSKRERR